MADPKTAPMVRMCFAVLHFLGSGTVFLAWDGLGMPVRSARIVIRDRVEALELAWRGRMRGDGGGRRGPKSTPMPGIEVAALPRPVQDALGHLLVSVDSGEPLQPRWREILDAYDWQNAPRRGKMNAK
jgi:hypothetical protein